MEIVQGDRKDAGRNTDGLEKDWVYDLYPFQRDSLRSMQKFRGRALLADEMGLGKTVQALAFLRWNPRLRPAVIVVPASLKLNWERECKKWIPNDFVHVISGGFKKEKNGILEGFSDRDRADIYIINYEILGKVEKYFTENGQQRRRVVEDSWTHFLGKRQPRVLICDEVHKIKNYKTSQAFCVGHLARRYKIPSVIGLSGTPFLNRPIELYNILLLLLGKKCPSWKSYTQRYCDASYNGFGWDYSGAKNIDELRTFLEKRVMVRRLKKDVLPDLPDKMESLVPVKLDNKDDYEDANEDFLYWLESNEGLAAREKAMQAEMLVKINVLRKLCYQGKMESVIAWIENFLESSEEKLVVFGIHKDPIKKVVRKFKDVCVSLTGETSLEERQEAVDRFQTDPKIRLFVGNIQAAGVGITLTASSSVAFFEIPWTPSEIVQASDRVHRIGQESKVNIYYLVSRNTIETTMLDTIHNKGKVFTQAFDGKKGKKSAVPGIRDLVDSYRKRKKS